MEDTTPFRIGWLGRVGMIGADPRDSDEVRLRKILLVVICLAILPISIAWGAIYLALGVWAGLIAWLYTLVSVVAIAVFARTKDVDWLLRVELTNILLAPTVSMAFAGGFVATGAVGLWGILAPLGALIFQGARAGVTWFIAFVVVFVLTYTLAQTTVLAFRTAASARGTRSPAGAKMIAASSGSGGCSSVEAAQTAPSSRANP